MPTAKKISELDFAATLVNANEIELEQSGNSVSAVLRDPTGTRADLWAFLNPCGVECAQVTIVTGSVLTLNATPITIVAAPGAGLAIEVVRASAELQFNSVAYATFGLLHLTTATATREQFIIGTALLFGSLSKIIIGDSITFNAGAADTQIIANQALTVTVNAGDPTAGDSPIIVRVMYRLISV